MYSKWSIVVELFKTSLKWNLVNLIRSIIKSHKGSHKIKHIILLQLRTPLSKNVYKLEQLNVIPAQR